MAISYRAPHKQAAWIMKQVQGDVLRSVGTVRNYEQALTRVCEWVQEYRLGDLRSMETGTAERYLEARCEGVRQSTLDMERQALQCMMQHVTGRLDPGQRLPIVRSEIETIEASRAYTPEQIEHIGTRQREDFALSTAIAYAAGLRAHELLTLRPVAQQPPDPRPALASKFADRDGEPYTVTGKGGLTREVRLPAALASRLEERRLDTAVQTTDRGIHYMQHYDLPGGLRWSASFSAASSRSLGWSNGAHGLRHSYAQERMDELQYRYPYETALETVSQEMGHFRPDITEVYLR